MSTDAHYVVAHEWPDGTLGFYAFHGSEVLYCNKKEAIASLECVKSKNPIESKEYKLYKLKLKEVA